MRTLTTTGAMEGLQEDYAEEVRHKWGVKDNLEFLRRQSGERHSGDKKQRACKIMEI